MTVGFFGRLFDTSDFPPRWGCGNWNAELGWLHIVSDLLTFGAYITIPLALAYFVIKRGDIAFPKVFWLFGAFIAACGTVHLIEAGIFWWPAYRLSGLVKAITAVVSWATVIVLIRVLPEALRFPGLADVNRRLEHEIAENRRAADRLRRYSDELKRSNDELDRFAYVASHDLKAPLRAVDNLASWIEEDSGDLDDASRRHLAQMRQRVGRMDRLLDDLLLYSRAGRVHGDVGPVALVPLVEEVIDLLAPPPGFRFEIAGDPLTLETARIPLEQCLRNLIGNAVKHADRESGTVSVTWRACGEFIEFAVTDDGPGIAPEYHERIFEMFQVLRPRDEVEGSGMGLAVIRKTVDGYGGRVTLESEPGRGSTFRFTWPRRFPAAARVRDEASASADAIGMRGIQPV